MQIVLKTAPGWGNLCYHSYQCHVLACVCLCRWDSCSTSLLVEPAKWKSVVTFPRLEQRPEISGHQHGPQQLDGSSPEFSDQSRELHASLFTSFKWEWLSVCYRFTREVVESYPQRYYEEHEKGHSVLCGSNNMNCRDPSKFQPFCDSMIE